MTDNNTLSLEPSLSHAAAEGLLLSVRAKEGSSLMVDASAVEHLGAQCATVLLAAAKAWDAAGHDFAVINRSVAFNENIARLGFSPSDIPGEENVQ